MGCARCSGVCAAGWGGCAERAWGSVIMIVNNAWRLMVLGASADWRGSSGLRLAYVNEERGSAISRLAPPNDASPRHRQRRLREAPTAVAAAAAAAAATHTRTRQEGSVLHTLYTTYVQGSLVGGGHDLRFSVCLSSLTRLFLLLCFFLSPLLFFSGFFFFFLFHSASSSLLVTLSSEVDLKGV